MKEFTRYLPLSLFMIAMLSACTQHLVIAPGESPPPGGADAGLVLGNFAEFRVIEVTPGEFYGAGDSSDGPFDERLRKLEDRIDELRNKREEGELSDEEKKELDELLDLMQGILDALNTLDLIDSLLDEILNMPDFPTGGFPGGVNNWLRIELGKQGIGLVDYYRQIGTDISSGRVFYNVTYYHHPSRLYKRTGNYCDRDLYPLAVEYDRNKLFCSGLRRR